MRSLRAARALAAVAGIAIAGCYSPSIMDGTLMCTADGRCPRGFTCRGDNLCYAGASDDAAIDSGTDSRAFDARTRERRRRRGWGGGGGAAGSVGTGSGGSAGGGAGSGGIVGTGKGGADASGSAGASGAAGAGRGGTSGGAGTSGAAGTGRGGTTGIAGTSGAAGTGRGGTTGGAGTSGAAGTGRGGTTGLAGTSGAAGTTGVAGNGRRRRCWPGRFLHRQHVLRVGVLRRRRLLQRGLRGKVQACDVATSRGTCTQVTSGPPHGARGACTGTTPCARRVQRGIGDGVHVPRPPMSPAAPQAALA